MPGGRYRRIALRRTGGLMASMRPLEVEVDLRSGDPAAAGLAELLAGVDLAALSRRPASSAGVADGFCYALVVEGGDGRRELSFGQGELPAELRPVVRELERRAMERLRRRREGAGGS